MDPKFDNSGTSLSQFYNDLKADMNKPAPNPMMKVSGGMMGDHMHPGAHQFRHQASIQANKLANDCHKHMILDIYMKVLPLDQDYVCGHHGQMSQDIDNMLASKGMNATQYLTSCYEATKAPLLEFLLRSGNLIARQFKEKADETLKDAQDKNIEVPAPEAPKADSNEVQEQLVDVKQDPEYVNFIDKLKEKTINKIVSDVSKIISDKKEEKSMTFDTSGTSIADAEAQVESTTSVAMNYLQKKMMIERGEFNELGGKNRAQGLTKKDDKKEKDEKPSGRKRWLEDDMVTPNGSNRSKKNDSKAQSLLNQLESADVTEQMLGLAIREATLNEINTCFKQTGTSFREYANRIRLGKGYVITESAIQAFTEELSEKTKQAVNEVAAKKAENATKVAEALEQDKKDEKAATEKIKDSVDDK